VGGVVHWEYLKLGNQQCPPEAIHTLPVIPAGFMGVEFPVAGVMMHSPDQVIAEDLSPSASGWKG